MKVIPYVLMFFFQSSSLFGKTIQASRDLNRLKFVRDPKEFEGLVRLPQYRGAKIFNESLVAVNLREKECFFSRPYQIGELKIYIKFSLLNFLHLNQFLAGFSILELAKYQVRTFLLKSKIDMI